MTCLTCAAVEGNLSLTNAPRVELDEHWLAEHVHPVATPGWIVMVLRRHARALHELTADESASLGHWLPRVVAAVHAATGSELEYVMQFAEGEGFHHVHVHIVARTADWPSEFRGPNVFAAMSTDHPIDAETATGVMVSVAAHLGRPVSG